ARLPRLEQLLRWCCRAALVDADLWEKRDQVRIGMVIGIGAEWLILWERDSLAGNGQRLMRPGQETTAAIERTRQALRLPGPAVSVSAACASGNVALGLARQWLRAGWVDVVLAGACDMGVAPMSLASFGNLRALSRRNNDPRAASRPF